MYARLPPKALDQLPLDLISQVHFLETNNFLRQLLSDDIRHDAKLSLHYVIENRALRSNISVARNKFLVGGKNIFFGLVIQCC